MQEPPKQVAAPAPPITRQIERKKGPGCLGAFIAIVAVLWAIGAMSQCQSETARPSPSDAPTSASPTTYTAAERSDWLKVMLDEKQPAAQRLRRTEALIANFPNSEEAAEAKEFRGKLQIAAAQAALNPPGDWRYRSYVDEMSSKAVKTATLQSNAPFELDFPYQGAQHATIQLRRHPKWGKNVIFSIEKGQLTCDVYECKIRVRFGDGQPVTYIAGRAEDGSSEVAFIPQYDGFLDRMRKVNSIRIEFSVYQGGNIVQEFNVRGFDQGQM